ncbi:hypothetical protein PtB15_2B257 [Puccinia triticina]|nr:hypothetical protein PtB15_2B257 [Puccinia triticina]
MGTLSDISKRKYSSKSVVRYRTDVSDHEHNPNGILSNLALLLAMRLFPEEEVYSRDREHHPFRKAIFMAIRLMLKHDLVQLTHDRSFRHDIAIARQLLRCGLIEDEINSVPTRLTLANHDFRQDRLPTLFGDKFWYQMVRCEPQSSFRSLPLQLEILDVGPYLS